MGALVLVCEAGYVYLRLIAPPSWTMSWEHELYEGFAFTQDTGTFYSFESDEQWIGVNFADADEAAEFVAIAGENAPGATTGSRKGTRSPPKKAPDAALIRSASSEKGRSSLSKAFSFLKLKISRSSPSEPVSEAKPKDNRQDDELTVEDVGEPTNFCHLSHIGFDASTGAFDTRNIPPEWRRMFEKAGVTEGQLKNPETARFIAGFVDGKRRQAPPPVPARAGRKAPPPPPPSRQKPPLPSRGGASASSTPAVDAGRGQLLASIRSTGVNALRKVDPDTQSKKSANEDAATAGDPNDIMASMLAKALADRNRRIAASDSEEEGSAWQ